MRIRTKKWAKPELAACGFYCANPRDNSEKWQSAFKQNNPLHLELGCGKGIFTSQIALENRNINYLAIDMSTDILGVCARNIKKTFNDIPADNILITNYNIEHIENILSKADEAERIYINFCNPWQKPKHNKRRLTHPTKLEKYKTFLSPDGKIYFKTDDDNLFADSINYFKESGFKISRITYDLHSENYTDKEPNITTEHEEMFTAQGIKIKFLECCLI